MHNKKWVLEASQRSLNETLATITRRIGLSRRLRLLLPSQDLATGFAILSRS